MSNEEKRQGYLEQILANMLSNIPGSYNKEVMDTNFYKLLRAVTQELTDARISIDEIKDNTYLSSATGDSIYNNFGVYAKLQKRENWTEDKYKSLITGVTSSLLKGPNKDSLLEAFKLFTQFDVKVFELYKDKDLIDPGVYDGYNPKYTFLLQIEKPIESTIDTSSLVDDANYIINIIKPAHTIGIYVVNLKGEEDFRHYYGVEKKIIQITKAIEERTIGEVTNGWLAQNLNEKISNYARNNSVSIETATYEIYMQNYGVSPDGYDAQLITKTEELYQAYVNSFISSPYSLNATEDSIPVLTKEHFKKLAVTELRGVYDKEYYQYLLEQHYAEYIGNMTSSQLSRIINNTKSELIRVYVLLNGNENDYTDEEWTEKAIAKLKEDACRNMAIATFEVVNDLGIITSSGSERLYSISLAEAKTYTEQLEQNSRSAPYYKDLDKVYMETDNSHPENKFGWKSLSHPAQFKTSITFTGSKIGGTDLIGPLYIMDDNVHQEFRIRLLEIFNEVRDDSNELGVEFREKYDKLKEEFGVFDIGFSDKYSLATQYGFQVNNIDSKLNDPNYILLPSSKSSVDISNSHVEYGYNENIQFKNTIVDIVGRELEFILDDKYDKAKETSVSLDAIQPTLTDAFNKPQEDKNILEVGVEDVTPFKTQKFGFRLNSRRLGLNKATNTLSVTNIDSRTLIEISQGTNEESNFFHPTDSASGELFTVDGNGNKTVVEQRAI
ncbi:hypothetical protein D3C76_11410 [compost metagenome]